MSSQILASLESQAARTVDVETAAAGVINGFGQRLADAVAAALANGATAEELAPVQAEVDALAASADSLATAIATVPAP